LFSQWVLLKFLFSKILFSRFNELAFFTDIATLQTKSFRKSANPLQQKFRTKKIMRNFFFQIYIF